ncbi:MAG: NADH dehydrogenase [Candidatus Hydrogenedentes bacterium]|nr:NADH dehydrogenase [Candidatus Hydrogenedentota bacterium]
MPDTGAHIVIDRLSGLAAGGLGVFFVLIAVYAAGYLRGRGGRVRFYAALSATALLSVGAVLANHLIVLAVCWGATGLFMYLLIGMPRTEGAAAAAKKTFIILGATDAFMLLGLAFLWRLDSPLYLDQVHLALDTPEAIWAYLLLAAAALAKAGAMPFHSWVADTAEHAPVPVTAFLPASADKLLGIYLLLRLNTGPFVLPPWAHAVLLAIGSVTIVGAVLMALVQHDLKRLLGYHAVSQVGYMVVGIGAGNPIGIAGGLFHMLNNALYKTALFLCAGNVERQAGTTDLNRLGGLARTMPWTFAIFCTASLAIAGIPPLNGFTSKWMIYQGLLERGRDGDPWWAVWIICALFGSVLTLASFVKLAHAVFLGQPSADPPRQVAGEASPIMWAPAALLALVCVVFGLFAWAVPLHLLVYPAVPDVPVFAGLWQPLRVSLALLLALGGGALFYAAAVRGHVRIVEPFVGGERLASHPEMRLSGTDFYDTIENLPVLRGVYRAARNGHLDVYEWGKRLALGLNRALAGLHNGLLPRYLAWMIAAALLLLCVLWR